MHDAIWTVGHSTHPVERLIGILQQHGVTAVADVRSQPYSRVNAQFNREAFRDALRRAGLAYVFLGAELGARASDPTVYVEGRVEYGRLARTAPFLEGIARLRRGVGTHRIAILCAEKDPLRCHRGILISRHLAEVGIVVRHILSNGTSESHDEALARLLSEVGLGDSDLFQRREDLVALAYGRRGNEIAYVWTPVEP